MTFLDTFALGCVTAALVFILFGWLANKHGWGREDAFPYAMGAIFLFLAVLCLIPRWSS